MALPPKKPDFGGASVLGEQPSKQKRQLFSLYLLVHHPKSFLTFPETVAGVPTEPRSAAKVNFTGSILSVLTVARSGDRPQQLV